MLLSAQAIRKIFDSTLPLAPVLYGFRYIYGTIECKMRIYDDGLYEVRPDTRHKWSSGLRIHKFAARGGFLQTGVPVNSENLYLFKDRASAEAWLKEQYIALHKAEAEVIVTIQQNKDYLSSYVLS